MKYTAMLILTLTMCTFSSQAIDLMVVANTDITDINVKKREVRDIFMGSSSQFPLKPVALTPDNEARLIFNTKIVGLTESRIQSYWAQMRFSGRKKPPIEFDSVESLLTFMINNQGTIAYLPSNTKLPTGFTVIYRTE